VFATAVHFHPSLIFAGKAGANQMEPFMGLHSNVKLLAIPKTWERLRWKWMAVANTLAYYNKATFASVKSLIAQPPGTSIYKYF
jgi:hypothetical protein